MAIIATTSVRLPSPRTQTCLLVDTSAGSWAFGSPDDAHFYFAADVLVNDAQPMPPNLASGRSPWEVGFIQNIVSETVSATFDGNPPITTSVTTACLDAMSTSSPWIFGTVNNILHYNRLQGVNSFWYRRNHPLRFRISMADWPRFTVFNFFGGGSYPRSRGGQIRSAVCTRQFRTWIAAREQTSPANLASSYVLLQMIEFAIRATITMSATGANPLFDREVRAAHAGTNAQLPAFGTLDVAADYGNLVDGSFVAGALRWGAPAAGIQPVVVPPFANNFYPAQNHSVNGNIGPDSISITSVRRCLQTAP